MFFTLISEWFSILHYCQTFQVFHKFWVTFIHNKKSFFFLYLALIRSGAVRIVQSIFRFLCFRYPKVIASAIQHFKKYNLDAIFIATNAPGRSAFNRVERRMAPLSSELSELVLKHDSFGTHLDSNGKWIDEELERENFAGAGKLLATVWSDLVIDGHAVFAEFKEPVSVPDPILDVDSQWYATHVRESQYLLQVFKSI